MIDASPCLPPILRASIRCNGNNVTARMIDQTARCRNGEKTRKHITANAPMSPTRITVSHKLEGSRRSNPGSCCVTGFINPYTFRCWRLELKTYGFRGQKAPHNAQLYCREEWLTTVIFDSFVLQSSIRLIYQICFENRFCLTCISSSYSLQPLFHLPTLKKPWSKLKSFTRFGPTNLKGKLTMSNILSFSSLSRSSVLIKLSVIAILLTCSVRALAGCSTDQQAGWEIFSICQANFDGHGQYVNSTCTIGDPPSGSQTSMNMCMPAASVGGCSGSACTWDAPLND